MKVDEGRLKIILVGGIAFCAMSGALLYLFFGDTAAAQAIRLARLEKYQAFLEHRLENDPRFECIRVNIGTSKRGGIVKIWGALKREYDLVALKELVGASGPPGPVEYRVALPPDQ